MGSNPIARSVFFKRRRRQVVRQGSAKPLFRGSNPLDASSSMTNMKICPNCGQRNYKDDRFCSRCGNAIDDIAIIIDQMEYAKLQPKPNEENKLHEYKDYPMLSAITVLLKILGWLSIIAGVILFSFSIMNVLPGVRHLPIEFTNGNLIEGFYFFGWLLGMFIASPFYVFIGLAFVAGGESLQLFIDLQENADRQSILLSLIYY